VLAALLLGVGWFIASDPGQVTIVWRGYEIRTFGAVLAALSLILGALIAFLFWASGLPHRIVQASRRRKRDNGLAALESAMLAAAAGDPRTARREARRAQSLLERDAVPRLIAAQAAEQMGDLIGAETQYAGMLVDPRTEIVGRRGLAASALSRRDYEAAIMHASQAFAANRDARWAFDLLFDARVQAGRWEEASETLAEGGRRHLPEDVLRRRRAVLLAAAARSFENTAPQRARELAEQSASLSPSFAPAAALASRLLVQAGKTWRAAGLLEEAWTTSPHPAIALAYRDLKPDEGDTARAKRMLGLAQLNPQHRESRIIRAEQALADGDGAAAEEALAPLLQGDPSARLCGLAARAAQARGEMTNARRWTARATLAAGEPDWSDLDPEGPAFAYTRGDWTRLVYSYGDTGRLIHPRHERFERERLTAPTHLLLEPPEATFAVNGGNGSAERTPVPPPWEPASLPWEPPDVAKKDLPGNGGSASPALGPKTPAPVTPPAAKARRRGFRSSPAFYSEGRQPDDPGVEE
jgi:HemY protein